MKRARIPPFAWKWTKIRNNDGWSEDMIITFKSSVSYIAQTRCGVTLLFAQERTCMSNVYIDTESGGELD